MTVDLDGMLANAIRPLRAAGEGGAAFMLEELARHLRELRDRWRGGDTSVVDEFFALYVLDEKETACHPTKN